MGPPAAKVTSDRAEASRLVARGTPAVLVGEDAQALGHLIASSCEEDAHERLLAVMVGDPADPVVAGAAHEMAAELWPGGRP
jgi:hypothetical protein